LAFPGYGFLIASVMIFHRGIQIENEFNVVAPFFRTRGFVAKSVESFSKQVSQNLFF
jgi:hypothetical protein